MKKTGQFLFGENSNDHCCSWLTVVFLIQTLYCFLLIIILL